MPTNNSHQIPWTNKLVTSTASAATKRQSSFYQPKKNNVTFFGGVATLPSFWPSTRQPWWQPFWLPRVPQGGCLVVLFREPQTTSLGGLPGWYTFYIFFVWDLAILQLKEFWAYWLTGPSWHWCIDGAAPVQGSSHVVGIRIICDEQARVSCRKETSFSQIHSSFIWIILLLWYGKQILMFTRFAKFLVKYGDFKHCTTMDVVFPHLAMRLGCHLAAHGQVRFFLPVKTTKKTQSSIWAFQDWIEDLKERRNSRNLKLTEFSIHRNACCALFFNFQHFGILQEIEGLLVN